MSDRKQKRLELLRRLREMSVEQARADHVAARSELEACSSKCADTEDRLVALNVWQGEQLSAGSPLAPELLRQAQLFRSAEQQTLEQQRAAEAKSQERTEAARNVLGERFTELSAVERLATRNGAAQTQQQIHVSYLALDEAGIYSKSKLEAKE